MKKTDKFNSTDDLENININDLKSCGFEELLTKNSKIYSDEKNTDKEFFIKNINENIDDFQESLKTIQMVLSVYHDEYRSSIAAVNEFDKKLEQAEKTNNHEKIQELKLVREYYVAKVLIIENEIKLKNKRIELIDQMIKFLKIKLKNINIYP